MRDINKRNAEMYEAMQNGETFKSIGARYGVCGTTVRDACWRHERLLQRQHDPLWNACVKHCDSDTFALRLYNTLILKGFSTIEKLREAKLTDDDMLKMRNVGRKSINVIRKIIDGLSTEESFEHDPLYQACLTHAPYKHQGVRLYNTLVKDHIYTIEDLKCIPDGKILGLRGVGPTLAMIIFRIKVSSEPRYTKEV